MLLVVAVALPIGAADSAKSLFNKGKDAEARQNYEAAFDFYRQAYDQKPKDLAYRAAYERTRFLAGASHVHRGQLLREAGKLPEAMVEFQKAAEIDSSSFIAQQELRRTQKLIDQGNAAPPPGAAAAPPTGLQKRVQEAQGPVDLAAISNVPITIKMTEDTKIIYETVGKLAGINVLFDPDYTSRRVKIELNGVSEQEALEIIALESKTFWRPVTPNTIFVASDNPAKRKEIEQSVIKTFYLANLSQPTELQDVVNALRQILEISRIQPLPSQGALVVRGTPDQLALAEKLVGDLDKARPEVIVEVAIMQVSRDKTRNLGISPPTSATVALQNNINSTTGTTTTTNDDHEHHHLRNRKHDQSEPHRQPERDRLYGNDSRGDGNRSVRRQQHQTDPEPADPRSGWTESLAQDRRPGAGGDRFVPAWYRWCGHQSAGQHPVSISGCRREYRHHPQGSCRTRSHVEGFDGYFLGDRTVEYRRNQPAGDRAAQDRTRNSPQGRRSEHSGWNSGRSGHPVAQRHSRAGADSDPEIPLCPEQRRAQGKRNCLCPDSSHHPGA